MLFGWPLLGGVLFMAAVGIKLSAALVLPFVLVAARDRRRILAGAALGALVMGVVSYEAFGTHLTSMVDAMVEPGPDERLDFAFDVLVQGVAALARAAKRRG